MVIGETWGNMRALKRRMGKGLSVPGILQGAVVVAWEIVSRKKREREGEREETVRPKKVAQGESKLLRRTGKNRNEFL